MRPDQKQRLDELSEKLADVVLEEADPGLWPGAGTDARDMDQETRGNRYWCKKNATASITLLLKVQQVAENTPAAIGRDPRNDEEQETAIRSAEKKAEQMLKQIQAKAYGKA